MPFSVLPWWLGCPDRNAATSLSAIARSLPPSPPSAVVPGFVRGTVSPSTPLPHRLLLHPLWFQGSTDLWPDGIALFHFSISGGSRLQVTRVSEIRTQPLSDWKSAKQFTDSPLVIEEYSIIINLFTSVSPSILGM
ncbi:hypothetical protein U9M48_042268 [Paspalum notatum var. saurae]|uniref:Uncharacterized protein n=1 Tax=Paspalum notatum var. saurae TaxID=547442 RepID=A0AAQ3XF17_PASNO